MGKGGGSGSEGGDAGLLLAHRVLLAKKCYLRCGAVVYPLGCAVPRLGLVLRPGLAEDFVLHLCNNHTILSCVLGAKGSPYSRTSRRLVFITQHIFVFFLVAVTNTVLDFAGVSTSYTALFNIAVLQPVTLALNLFLKYAYTSSRTARLVLSVSLMLVGAALLAVCAMFTDGESRYGILLKYFLQFHVLGSAKELLGIALQFCDRFSLSLELLGGRSRVLAVGTYYSDYVQLHTEELLDEEDFVSYRRVLGGPLQLASLSVLVDAAFRARCDRRLRDAWQRARQALSWVWQALSCAGRRHLRGLPSQASQFKLYEAYESAAGGESARRGSSSFLTSNPLHLLPDRARAGANSDVGDGIGGESDGSEGGSVRVSAAAPLMSDLFDFDSEAGGAVAMTANPMHGQQRAEVELTAQAGADASADAAAEGGSAKSPVGAGRNALAGAWQERGRRLSFMNKLMFFEQEAAATRRHLQQQRYEVFYNKTNSLVGRPPGSRAQGSGIREEEAP